MKYIYFIIHAKKYNKKFYDLILLMKIKIYINYNKNNNINK